MPKDNVTLCKSCSGSSTPSGPQPGADKEFFEVMAHVVKQAKENVPEPSSLPGLTVPRARDLVMEAYVAKVVAKQKQREAKLAQRNGTPVVGCRFSRIVPHYCEFYPNDPKREQHIARYEAIARARATQTNKIVLRLRQKGAEVMASKKAQKRKAAKDRQVKFVSERKPVAPKSWQLDNQCRFAALHDTEAPGTVIGAEPFKPSETSPRPHWERRSKKKVQVEVGTCYLPLVKVKYQARAYKKLGPMPKAGDVLTLPVRFLRSLSQVVAVRSVTPNGHSFGYRSVREVRESFSLFPQLPVGMEMSGDSKQAHQHFSPGTHHFHIYGDVSVYQAPQQVVRTSGQRQQEIEPTNGAESSLDWRRPGYCYLLLLARRFWHEAAYRLEAYPPIDELYLLPSEWLEVDKKIAVNWSTGKYGPLVHLDECSADDNRPFFHVTEGLYGFRPIVQRIRSACKGDPVVGSMYVRSESPLNPGRCYTLLFPVRERQRAEFELGDYPTVFEVYSRLKKMGVDKLEGVDFHLTYIDAWPVIHISEAKSSWSRDKLLHLDRCIKWKCGIPPRVGAQAPSMRPFKRLNHMFWDKQKENMSVLGMCWLEAVAPHRQFDAAKAFGWWISHKELMAIPRSWRGSKAFSVDLTQQHAHFLPTVEEAHRFVWRCSTWVESYNRLCLYEPGYLWLVGGALEPPSSPADSAISFGGCEFDPGAPVRNLFVESVLRSVASKFSGSRMAGMAKPSTEGLCWAECFPECDGDFMSAKEFRAKLKGRYLALKAEERRIGMPNKLAWQTLDLEWNDDGYWHCSNIGRGALHLTKAINAITLKSKELPHSLLAPVGLTTAVVLGTIGDVEPTLDVVAKNYEVATTEEVGALPADCLFEHTEKGHGWCSSDFQTVDPQFCKALRDSVGSAKGELKVTPPLWNRICSCWSGAPVSLSRPEEAMPGAFIESFELTDLLAVPPRTFGPHKRLMPPDFVLVTHEDHVERYKGEGWECRSIPVNSHEFIKLGQDILANWSNLEMVKRMLWEVFKGLRVAHEVGLQSDLLYLVSGTTFHYFLKSIFPDKQVYEVCPVPREDNGVCPEFYLAHAISLFTSSPRAGYELGRVFSQHIVAKKYLEALGWDGVYKYQEPPKIHSVQPWAADKWAITSPNVGFKPYADFRRKTSFVFRGRIKAYLSLGSCATLDKKTYEVIGWLKTLPVDWHVDTRWSELVPGCTVVPFTDHARSLADFDWVVHHGGSGVTCTCLVVGVPQTILPQIGDQFVWAKALEKQLVPPFLSSKMLKSVLFSEWSVSSVSLGPRWVPQKWRDIITDLGAEWVEPFFFGFNCCHDRSTFGWKDGPLQPDRWLTDQVIAHTTSHWICVSKDQELKWIGKHCGFTKAIGPVGTLDTATYPRHSHGWLENHPFAWAVSPHWYNEMDDEEKWEWSMLNTRACDHWLKTLRRQPVSGNCTSCGGYGHSHAGLCSACLSFSVAPHVDEVKEFAPAPEGVERLKPPSKGLAGSERTVGAPIRSMARYWVADSRCLVNAPIQQVGRHLLSCATKEEKIDQAYMEAYWLYCKWVPPHYEFKHNVQPLIAAAEEAFGKTDLDTLFADCMEAIGSVLSVSSFKAIFERKPWRLFFTGAKRRNLEWGRWHVLVDALRHFEPVLKEFGHPGLPGVCARFPVLPAARISSFISYGSVLPKPLGNGTLSNAWFKRVSSRDGLYIHFFALRLPQLGKDFGLFHAVVQFGGKYWELQQKSGMRVHINITRTPPEARPERPLVKTVQVHDRCTGSITEKWLTEMFDDLSYRVLGDNCLVFSNLIVWILTGTVVNWAEFGLFGQDLHHPWGEQFSQLFSSYYSCKPHEKKIRVNHEQMSQNSTWFGGLTEASKEYSWVGPKLPPTDYGLHNVRRVQAFIETKAPDGEEDTPWTDDILAQWALEAYKVFGLSANVFSSAIWTIRSRHIQVRTRDLKLWKQLQVRVAQLASSRLAQDVQNVVRSTAEVVHPLRDGKKVVWTPLFNLKTPLHWFRQGNVLVEHHHEHLPENLSLKVKKKVALDLPQIFSKYKQYFPDVQFPELGLKRVGKGEYEVGVKVPLRTRLPKMDKLTLDLIQDLREATPFELGVFSLRFGTVELAEKITDRYFTGSFEAGQLIDEQTQQEIADAIFRNERHLYENAQLINPAEVWKKWKRNYSAGFPFRFNAKGQAKREELVKQCGGKEGFLSCIRSYIESGDAFPTVSHSFIKDEVLPESYIERQKIRTIIAQDPLNYYMAMACQGDHSKRLDPSSFSAVGVSSAHGEMVALAHEHLKYSHHFAMDVTALDSTAAIDAVETIKRVRKLGFKDHAQREAVESMIDLSYDNLVSSWIIDIHSGRARFKKQGLTTGHASTTGSNTDYMRVLILAAWKGITGRPIDEFYDTVKFSSYSDDNYWSTNLDPSVFSGQKVAEYWLQRGVQVRVEAASDDLSQISFLAKRFSFDEKHLTEAREIAGVDVKVALVHDLGRLLTKFSDFKKANTLTYRWERGVALLNNLAHHRETFDRVNRYLDALEPELNKRKHGRRFLKQHPRPGYEDVIRLVYVPKKTTQPSLVVSSVNQVDTFYQKIVSWWDTFKVDVMTFDSEVSSYARVLQNISGLLEIGGLTPEDVGFWLRDPGSHKHDNQFTLEHHCYLLNGCPETFEKFASLCQKSPFSAFMDAGGFWARRNYYSVSEEVANGLRCKVAMLLGFYSLAVWMENQLKRVPLVGPMYNLFVSSKDMSASAYSKLNSLYWLLWGDSSRVLSALMPKDRYLPVKAFAYSMWCNFTALDCFDLSGDLDPFRNLFEAMTLLIQDVNGLVFEADITVLLPTPGSGRVQSGSQPAWKAIDHSDAVASCRTLLEERKTPLVTGPTGCGKSTDFICGLAKDYETVIVACPRRILVQENPVAETRLFAGCRDTLTPGCINFGTSGYLRRALTTLGPGTILVLDEFHELDEDSLWLHSRFEGEVICVSATPEFSGSSLCSPVRLTKSRTVGHTVHSVIKSTAANVAACWDELNAYPEEKTLVIVPGPKDCEELARHAARYCPGKRVCTLYRGHTVVTEADWYFGTAVVDAGITIPGLTHVIDMGCSRGWRNGKFVTEPSSHNVSDQRRGRTGRTCSGKYTRLQTSYVDTPFDPTTPFIFNEWGVVKRWYQGIRAPAIRRPGVLSSLPFGYESLMEDHNWSALIYLTFLYENRGDVQRARVMYQDLVRFPERPQFSYILNGRDNHGFKPLEHVELDVQKHRVPGQDGNFWDPLGQSCYLLDLTIPVPRHLRDE
nr:polyprotein [Botryosphaeria dothidea hypovirus 1]